MKISRQQLRHIIAEAIGDGDQVGRIAEVVAGWFDEKIDDFVTDLTEEFESSDIRGAVGPLSSDPETQRSGVRDDVYDVVARKIASHPQLQYTLKHIIYGALKNTYLNPEHPGPGQAKRPWGANPALDAAGR